VDLPADSDYFSSWDKLGDLIRAGRSFSGHERNCCFLNTGDGRFADVSSATGFDFPDDGRAVALTDWDHDGDLDVWLSNRSAPRVRFLRNDIPSEHHFVSLRLQGTDCNRDAIGARVELDVGGDRPRRLVKTVRAGDGFLSQSSKWLHFGLGAATVIERVRVRWPGSTACEQFAGIQCDGRYQLTQGHSQAMSIPRTARAMAIAPSVPQVQKTTDEARIVLARRHKLTPLEYVDFSGSNHDITPTGARPVFVTLWASWCQPCLAELRELAAHQRSLGDSNLAVVALCCDPLTPHETPDLTDAKTFLSAVPLPFPTGLASDKLMQQLIRAESQSLYSLRPVALPSSYLVDGQGRLAVIYRGAVKADQVLDDLRLLNVPDGAIPSAAFAMRGRFGVPRFPLTPAGFAQAFLEGGYVEDARRELRAALAGNHDGALAAWPAVPAVNRQLRLEAYELLARIERQHERWRESAEAYEQAITLSPDAPALHVGVALAQWNLGQRVSAEGRLGQLVRDHPHQEDVLLLVARAYTELGQVGSAVGVLRSALDDHQEMNGLRIELATALARVGETGEAIRHYRDALARDPQSIPAANQLAWIYATCYDEALRNSAAALTLAEQIDKATRHEDPMFLDTLAAAQAANGRFGDARGSIRRAIEIAFSTGQHNLVTGLRQRLAQYEAEEP
jgi:tetratricopeptide (TPR) repeat protein